MPATRMPQAIVTDFFLTQARKSSYGLYLWIYVRFALHQTYRRLLCSPACISFPVASEDTWLSALQIWAYADLSCATAGNIASSSLYVSWISGTPACQLRMSMQI